MKSAEEVAEEIVCNSTWHPEQDLNSLQRLIAQALTAFAEERVKEVYRCTCHGQPPYRCANCIAIGRVDALEEAAKWILQHGGTCESMAYDIRTLKGKAV